MKLKRKNLKVFVEVKIFFLRIFHTGKCALPLVSCLFTEEREIEFYVAFWRYLYIFILWWVELGWGRTFYGFSKHWLKLIIFKIVYVIIIETIIPDRFLDFFSGRYDEPWENSVHIDVLLTFLHDLLAHLL